MDISCHHIPISQSWDVTDDNKRIYIVDKIDGLWLCRNGEYVIVKNWEVSWEFERHWQSLSWEIGVFSARSCMIGLRNFWQTEHEQAANIIQGLRHGLLVGVRLNQGRSTRKEDPTVRQQQLVRQIEAKGRLVAGSKHYRLLAGADLKGIPDRDNFEVVRHEEARRIIEKLSKDSGKPADWAKLLVQAIETLSPDWRPPLTPNGIILLRKLVALRVASMAPEAAITPSQLRALMDAEKPLHFYARFVDEHGRPLTGFTGRFEHGSDPEEDMSFQSPGFSHLGEYRGGKQAWLKFPDKANHDLIAELKERWKGMRGKPDKAWMGKEENLVEILIQNGKLPELTLEAEKKHTFMLRQPTVLAKLSGMYFHINRCFLLPTALASLKRLIAFYGQNPGSEVLIVGHADSSGSEDYNLQLSCERAEALRCFLTDAADGWLAWYDNSRATRKRWGPREDIMMIEALVPEDHLAESDHVTAFQEWHNSASATGPGQPDATRPEGWVELEVDGRTGPKTRRQLILDYMAIDGTSLPKGTRVVTYGCGDYFPYDWDDKQANRPDDSANQMDRRLEVFLFPKPFGILPPISGVADGMSSKDAIKASRSDGLYPEWCTRASHEQMINAPSEPFRLWMCQSDMSPMVERPYTCKLGDGEFAGITDEQGFITLPHQEPGITGWVEVAPDEDMPDYKVRCDIEIGVLASPRTPLGAANRLKNLGYYTGGSTEDMTDELADAIRRFQMDHDGLSPTGELDSDTSAKLMLEHDSRGSLSESG
jgi:outer membrane protein OmpA-like peptidoglycan-associated protein